MTSAEAADTAAVAAGITVHDAAPVDPRYGSWALPRSASAARLARERVRHMLSGVGPLTGVDADLACLLTSEVVTNSLRHAQGAITLMVDTRPGHLLVHVHDGGPGRTGDEADAALFGALSASPHTLVADPMQLSERGRGLALVREVSDAWGVHRHRNAAGTTVWFRLGASRAS